MGSNVRAGDQDPAGKVFGFFYYAWGSNLTMLVNYFATS